MFLALALLLAGLPPSETDLEDARAAAIRSLIGADDGGYFKRYCIAANPGILSTPATRESRLGSTSSEPDPQPSLLARLRSASDRIVPASECNRKGEHVVHRSTGARPALFIVLGPAEVVTPHLLRFAFFYTSGFLTETQGLIEVAKKDAEWHVVRDEILLQS